MIDYKHKTAYTLEASTKKLPASRGRKGKQSSQLSYQSKFYLTIFLILLGCYAYVHYQIKFNDNSVFSDLANIFNKHRPKYSSNPKSTTKSKEPSAPGKPSTPGKPSAPGKPSPQLPFDASTGSAQRYAQDSRSGTAADGEPLEKKSLEKTRPVDIYMMKVENSSAVLMPIKTSIRSTRENYFKTLIATLIHFKSKDRKLINGFQNKIKIKNVYLENDVLILDFNQSFEFSRYGYAGLNLQIQQILWTVFNSKGAKVEKINNISL